MGLNVTIGSNMYYCSILHILITLLLAICELIETWHENIIVSLSCLYKPSLDNDLIKLFKHCWTVDFFLKISSSIFVCVCVCV